MPSLPKRPCAQPGCAALVTGVLYCEKHSNNEQNSSRLYDQYTRKSNPELALSAKIRNSARWQKVRAIHKAQFPLCCDPLKTHGQFPAYNQQSHHIKPLATHPECAFDLDNLAPLCTRCHSAIEAKERKGENTAHLFAAAFTQ